MGLLRLSAILFVLATTSVASDHYILQHRAVVTDLSRCGDADTLSNCLSELPDNNEQAIIGCFTSAGCNSQDARDEVTFVVKRFGEFPVVRKVQKRATSTDDSNNSNTKSNDSKDSSTADNKSKSDDATTKKASSTKNKSDDATTTADARTTKTSDKSTSASSRATSTIASSTTGSSSNGVMTGTECFTTHTKTTEYCQLYTTDGRTESKSCTEGKASSSQCGPNLICTTNSGGDDICMKHQDIQTEGIVIGIIMGLASIGVLGGTFFACFKGSRKQKMAEKLTKGKDSSTASLIPK